MRYSTFPAIAALLVLQQLPHNLVAQTLISPDDPIFGTWELDTTRSIYTRRDRPQAQRRIYEAVPEGVRSTVISISQTGTESVLSYTAGYDGAPSPLTGTESSDGIVLHKIGPRTAIATFTHAGLAVGTAERSVSANGQELTIKVELKGDVSSLSYYRRVE